MEAVPRRNGGVCMLFKFCQRQHDDTNFGGRAEPACGEGGERKGGERERERDTRFHPPQRLNRVLDLGLQLLWDQRKSR